MRFLLDMGISPRAADFLKDLGHEASHLHEQRLETPPDPEILVKARDEHAVLLTDDLEFADLVAASRAQLPSVVIFRLRSMRPENVSRYLGILLDQHGDSLREGAVVSVTESRIRLRPLPLGPEPATEAEPGP